MDTRVETNTRARNRVSTAARTALTWPYTFGVVLSVAVGVLTLIMSADLDLPMRDPEGFLGPAYVRLPALGLVFIAGGVFLQSLFHTRSIKIWGEAKRIIREDWTWGRLVHVALGLITFYVCYVSYRNLKSFLPFVRTDTFSGDPLLYDTKLMKLDRVLLFDQYPSTILHDLLGTGISAQVLSFIYVSYLALVPISLAALLVWNKDFSLGAWYATALSLNWVLGAASYYSLPTLGPAFVIPQAFTDLPNTGAAELQNSLFRAGQSVFQDPHGSKSIYGIAGFASLHVSVVVSACLFLQLTRAARVIRISAWTFLGLVVIATLYFGWHYVADDVAGAFIGWIAVVIGAWATGNRKHRHRLDEPSI